MPDAELQKGDFVRPIDEAKRYLGRGVIADECRDKLGRRSFTVLWLSGSGEGWLESDLEKSKS